MKIKVIEPGKIPYMKEVSTESDNVFLKELQDVVGGFIRPISLGYTGDGNNLLLFYNDDEPMKKNADHTHNCYVMINMINGTYPAEIRGTVFLILSNENPEDASEFVSYDEETCDDILEATLMMDPEVPLGNAALSSPHLQLIKKIFIILKKHNIYIKTETSGEKCEKDLWICHADDEEYGYTICSELEMNMGLNVFIPSFFYNELVYVANQLDDSKYEFKKELQAAMDEIEQYINPNISLYRQDVLFRNGITLYSLGLAEKK